jgi:hypothetical protein
MLLLAANIAFDLRILNIFASFLVYGIVAGLLKVWVPQNDFLNIFNIPGQLLGQEVYKKSILVIGDPHSSDAHHTIPWVLRIPQVFLPVSAGIWSLIGLAAHLAFAI